MSTICLVKPHTGRWPHKSGYSPTEPVQEYDFGGLVCDQLAAELALQVVGINGLVLDAGDKYNCKGACLRGIDLDIKKAVRFAKKKCAPYKASLRWLTEQSKSADLAVSFHLDYWYGPRPIPHGPICYSTSNARARQWSREFIKNICQERMVKHRAAGVFIWPEYKDKYNAKRKWFLERGNSNAVIVEVAVVNHPDDLAWLKSGKAIKQTVQAALTACHDVIDGD